jgi:hypothetical protein
VKLATTALERLAIGVASLLLSIGLIAVLSGFFAGRDEAGVSGGSTTTIGQVFPDLGHAHLRPGQPRPRSTRTLRPAGRTYPSRSCSIAMSSTMTSYSRHSRSAMS